MYIGKIVGFVVATRKDENLEGKKLLIVQRINVREEEEGRTEVAVDAMGAGTGEIVLVSNGSAAKSAFTDGDSTIDAAIVGIIDSLEV
ncbi:EutN/CcmL family microcompartment protein [Salipaludibacillus daqingensis]|uniref:EutN/CcmL family microcompartment protein n=1 Tax=Salipaludibacillus daqingensis TaxID=3041001 RepID=UPI00247715CE|nr:EutN/CcmL family microcompartment protein [Salipaludibacillus daqingensis]